jgi:lipopolysaccharide export LptBFGC system permease protein LptF
MENEKDPQLWKIAQRRVGFKYNLISYIVMSCFFWLIWFFAGERNSDQGFPWPIWPMLGWGIGLLFHFLGAYVFTSSNSVEREYEKLQHQTGHVK